jgi:brefeldin A-resistance guanine nucleotide exchange factor 1
VEEIFNRVAFPLVDELLKPQVFLRDPRGMAETRLRASALLCKTFMHFEVRDNRPNVDIRLLWIQVLDLLDRLMNTDKKDQTVRPSQPNFIDVYLTFDSTRPCRSHSKMSF